MTKLKIEYGVENDELPTGKWFIAKHKEYESDRIVTVQRVVWEVCGGEDVVVYLNEKHLEYDFYKTFKDRYDILKEVDEIIVR